MKAVATLAASSAKELVEEGADALQQAAAERTGLDGEEWRQGLQRAGQVGGGLARGVLEGGMGLGRTLLDGAGRTELGRELGASTRALTAILGELPVVSAVSDMRRAMHGIDALSDHLREAPDDPLRYVWLAEALEALARDRDRALLIKALLNPGSLLKVAALRTTKSLGASGEDARQRLLKIAFALTVEGLRRAPDDPELLDTLARIYLATGTLAEAARFARLAVLAAPRSGEPLVTLARVYLALGQTRNGRAAAKLATERGCTAGYALLADVVLEDTSLEPLERLRLHSVLIGRVYPPHMVNCYGPRPEGFELISAVGRAQWAKLQQLLASRQQPAAASAGGEEE